MEGRNKREVRLERDSMVFVGQMKHWYQCPKDNEKPPKRPGKESAGSGWI